MLRNLAASLLLTERETDEHDDNPPKVPGRVVTTLQKAKEVRPLIEKCITIARRSIKAQDEADRLDTTADRNTPEWREWRNGEQWQQWNQAIAPVLAARRRALKLLGDKEAVTILFEEIAPRFADRSGGYTRVVRLAKPRLGDAGTRAVLEFVGVRDRVAQESQTPAFEDEPEETAEDQPEAQPEETAETEPTAEEAADTSADAEKDAEEEKAGKEE